jgi:hypothetical protein
MGLFSDVEIKKGTLQAADDMTLSNKIITSGSAGGSINTIGHEVTLTGQITGDGRLVKTGGGTLNLANTSLTIIILIQRRMLMVKMSLSLVIPLLMAEY